MLKYKLNPVSNSRTAYISIKCTEAVAQRRSVTLLYLFIIFILYQYLLCLYLYLYLLFIIFILSYILYLFRGQQIIKRETLTQVFSCEFCEISKNTFSYSAPLGALSLFQVLIAFRVSEAFNSIIGVSCIWIQRRF